MRANTEVPKDIRERAIWVEYQLKLRRKTFASVARDCGCGRGTIRRALFLPSAPQEKALADAIGLTVQQLFPDRYDSEGNRLHFERERSSRAAKSKREAA